jgi:hypothetical protein
MVKMKFVMCENDERHFKKSRQCMGKNWVFCPVCKADLIWIEETTLKPVPKAHNHANYNERKSLDKKKTTRIILSKLKDLIVK